MENKKIYGYLRVSTEEQNIDNCKAEILLKKDKMNFKGDIEWVEEKVSGTKHWKERELGKCIEKCNKGDIIITSELSRIGRTMMQINEFVAKCAEKGVELYMVKTDFKVDNSIQSHTLLFAYSLSAQIERELIQSRTKEALAKRKRDGKILGRPKGHNNKELKLDKHINDIKKGIEKGIPLKRLAEDFKVSDMTMCNYVKKNNLKPKKEK